jgi:23S rRNA pseudouridine1911/1915/1917 synthase
MNKNDIKKKKEFRIDPKSITELKVHEECELFTFLQNRLPKLSRNNIKSILSNHQVAVDGAPISQYNFLLSKDDIVIVSKNRITKHKRGNLPIIYEDDELIVINKPSSLLSIASDKEKGKTAYRMVTDYLQQQDRHLRVYVTHRLDEDTSGVLLFSKNADIRDALQKSWQDIVTKRGYYAIVEGKMPKQEDTLKDYLMENSMNMMYVTTNKKEGKLCITNYKVIGEKNGYSLLDISIDSGRKNQIRVQLGHIGHFVIGDDKYGEPSNPIKRLGLHAYTLEFVHPINHKKYSFVAEMPHEFKTMFFLNDKKLKTEKTK